jgi:hypothetical protein
MDAEFVASIKYHIMVREKKNSNHSAFVFLSKRSVSKEIKA